MTYDENLGVATGHSSYREEGIFCGLTRASAWSAGVVWKPQNGPLEIQHGEICAMFGPPGWAASIITALEAPRPRTPDLRPDDAC
jgi:hypothetical protein